MKITSIKRYETDRDGNRYKGQFGEYTRLLVQVEDPKWGGRDISFFETPDKPSVNWKEGDNVDFEVKENGQYLNGVYNKKSGGDNALLQEIATRTLKHTQDLIELKEIVEKGNEKIGLILGSLRDIGGKIGLETKTDPDYPTESNETKF